MPWSEKREYVGVFAGLCDFVRFCYAARLENATAALMAAVLNGEDTSHPFYEWVNVVVTTPDYSSSWTSVGPPDQTILGTWLNEDCTFALEDEVICGIPRNLLRSICSTHAHVAHCRWCGIDIAVIINKDSVARFGPQVALCPRCEYNLGLFG